jgi:hypothetical protein
MPMREGYIGYVFCYLVLDYQWNQPTQLWQ